MDSYQPQHDNNSFTVPPLMNPPPQIFGGNDGSPTDPDFNAAPYFAEDLGGAMDESNDAKRRRIARVCAPLLQCYSPSVDSAVAGL
jgi:hypothetical protein